MKTVKPIKLKDGNEIPVGSCVHWKNGKALILFEGKERKIGALAAARALDITIPDEEQLGHWVVDSVCESVLGETVEPDGYDSEGSPSWLIAFGLI